MNDVSISHHQEGECKVDEALSGTILALLAKEDRMTLSKERRT